MYILILNLFQSPTRIPSWHHPWVTPTGAPHTHSPASPQQGLGAVPLLLALIPNGTPSEKNCFPSVLSLLTLRYSGRGTNSNPVFTIQLLPLPVVLLALYLLAYLINDLFLSYRSIYTFTWTVTSSPSPTAEPSVSPPWASSMSTSAPLRLQPVPKTPNTSLTLFNPRRGSGCTTEYLFSNNERISHNTATSIFKYAPNQYKGKPFNNKFVKTRQIHTRMISYTFNSSLTCVNLIISSQTHTIVDGFSRWTPPVTPAKGCVRLSLHSIGLMRLKRKRTRLYRLFKLWVQPSMMAVAGPQRFHDTSGVGACHGDSKGHNG